MVFMGLKFLALMRARSLAFGLWAALSGVAMVACGGGGGAGSDAGCNACVPPAAELTQGNETTSAGIAINKPATGLPSRQEATRFLTQATFGPTKAEVEHLMAVGYKAWLNEQFALPMAAHSHTAAWDAANNIIAGIDPLQHASSGEVTSTFWRQALTGPDQLRQRVAFALSEIFVVSIADSCGANSYARGAANYLDMLGRQAFGSYRALLEAVAVHPVMGCYLSHIQNQKEDLATGRVPDENFAREIMQLFSIGLYQLNQDGSLKLDGKQQAIETYSGADVAGLAKVFTGWSWACQEGLTSRCFFGSPSQPEQYANNMRGYALYHSTSEKRFLGTVIPADPIFATPESSLKLALDTLSSHPNVAPFIGKQLIQRLVTSNPSPAYVGRVSSAFSASGGNLRATVEAILLDPEARDMSALSSKTFGKVREPILRFSALLRGVGARSQSGMFLIMTTGDPGESLGQSAMLSPSVFNFFRPGYVLPGSNSGAAGLVAPEMQIASETSAAGYVNFLMQFMWSGTGRNGYDNKSRLADVQLVPTLDSNDPWLALADDPAALAEEINQRLMYGSMPAALKKEIAVAVGSLDFRARPTPTAEQVLNTRRYRLWSALLLTMVSPEFQIQK